MSEPQFPPKKTLPYIAPFEVVLHNKPNDIWVSFLGKVFDVTSIVSRFGDEDPRCVKPLLAMAGKDISHWFDERTGEIQHFVHPITGVSVPYCPHGPLPDIKCKVPNAGWTPVEDPPWWKNEHYQIGLLTKRVRPLRIINLLSCEETQLNVCSEDTFYRIQERYKLFNKDANSYTWRYMDETIELDKTMDGNGIVDERDTFIELGMPQNTYVPCVFLFYKDDMQYFEEDLLDDDLSQDDMQEVGGCDDDDVISDPDA